MSDIAAQLQALKPTRRANIMDLVQEAGADVAPWAVTQDGIPVANPRANPSFCYDWAFGGGNEPTVLCVWHENLRSDGANVEYSDNLRKMALDLEAAATEWRSSSKIRSRAKSQAKRARAFDLKVQHAFRKGQPVRMVLLEGSQRDRSAVGIDTSAVDFRLLDARPWQVEYYDDSTGAFRIVRGIEQDLLSEDDRVYQSLSKLSSEQYADAIADIDARMTGRQREMLVGHALAPGRTLSMEKIAALGGYDSYAVANVQYGKLAGMIMDALGISGLTQNMQAICELAATEDDQGHEQWTLRGPVLEGLRLLDLVSSKLDSPEMNEIDDVLSDTSDLKADTVTERKALVDARLGQGAYRKKMLRFWGGTCALTGCAVEAVLVASHAVPWKDCSSRERLDHFNGLLLTGTMDRLFDAGLIGFAQDGALLMSPKLSAADRSCLGLREGMSLRKTDDRLEVYLSRHRVRHQL